jgi:outer membrane protein OmpA-like peptidoglycan-associated protein
MTDKDVYIIVAAGPGAWAASEDNRTFYELVTLEAEPMEMGMVTSADIGKGISTLGRIAIYDIFFDTGQSDVKPESAGALKAIAEYLNANKTQKVLIVGHTDNTGDFDMNITLSKNRADAVMEKLISEYGVAGDQLKPYGAGPVSPVASNSTEQGRANNRRVEIVEQ